MSSQSLGPHKNTTFSLILFDKLKEPKYLLLVTEVKPMLWFSCSHTLFELLEGTVKGSI